MATIGVAYRYALPVYEISRLRYKLEFDPTSLRHLAPNRFAHKRKLATDTDRLVTGPNADTLYSIAFADLSGGPLRIDVPDTAGRYYSIALIDAYTNNFAYIGQRTTGTRAGSFLLVGPEYRGAGQDGLPVLHAPTPDVVLLLRILVDGPDDLRAADRLQDQFKLTSLGYPSPRSAPVAPIADSGENFVAVVNQALAADPPPAADAPILKRIGNIGIGPYGVPLTEQLRQAWNDDFAAVKQSLVAARNQRAAAMRDALVNGWFYKPKDTGNFGTDYATRAAVALSGLFASTRQENLSAVAYADNKGSPLDSHHRYRLHLPAHMPVEAFWSLSVHAMEPDGRAYFADNALHRYEMSDRTAGVHRNADGSLDISIQRDPPDAASDANWLPIPDGPFRLTLRNYLPSKELLDGQFHYAAVERRD